LGSAWAQPLAVGASVNPLKYTSPHTSYPAEFDRSRSNGTTTSVIKEMNGPGKCDPRVPPFKVIQGHRNRHITFRSNHGPTRTVSEINGDFSRKSQISPTPVYFAPPLKGSPWNWASALGVRKLEWWV